jgi:hypothetical protein
MREIFLFGHNQDSSFLISCYLETLNFEVKQSTLEDLEDNTANENCFVLFEKVYPIHPKIKILRKIDFASPDSTFPLQLYIGIVTDHKSTYILPADQKDVLNSIVEALSGLCDISARYHERFSTNLLMKVIYGNDLSDMVKVKNISLGGCRVEFLHKSLLRMEDKLRFEIASNFIAENIVEGEVFLKGIGIVKWIDPDFLRFGIEFIQIEESSFNNLEKFIQDLVFKKGSL